MSKYPIVTYKGKPLKYSDNGLVKHLMGDRTMSDKKYGSYTDEDINDWQTLPAVAPILTSSLFGAWLMRRDERRDKRKLEEIKAEIQNLSTNNFLEMIPKGEVVQIVDNHIKELNNE